VSVLLSRFRRYEGLVQMVVGGTVDEFSGDVEGMCGGFIWEGSAWRDPSLSNQPTYC